MTKPKHILRKLGITGVILIAAILVAGKMAGFGCASPQQQLATTQPNPTDLMEGQWSGAWASTSCDMGGALQCRIARLPSGDYQATFDAVFAKVLTNTSVVTLRVSSRERNEWSFAGEEDLGLLRGGVYKYTGHTTGQQFICQYDSSFDKGTFKMTRAVTSATQPVMRH